MYVLVSSYCFVFYLYGGLYLIRSSSMMSRSAASSSFETRSYSHTKKTKCLKEVLRCADAPSSSSWWKWWQYTMASTRNMRVYSCLMDCMNVFGKGVAARVERVARS